MESAFINDFGFSVKAEGNIRKDAYWFGEAQSRVVISVKKGFEENVVSFLNQHELSFTALGMVTKKDVIIEKENWGNIDNWKVLYDNAIGIFMGGE